MTPRTARLVRRRGRRLRRLAGALLLLVFVLFLLATTFRTVDTRPTYVVTIGPILDARWFDDSTQAWRSFDTNTSGGGSKRPTLLAHPKRVETDEFILEFRHEGVGD